MWADISTSSYPCKEKNNLVSYLELTDAVSKFSCKLSWLPGHREDHYLVSVT